jgi:hypothetical protein
VEPDLSLLAIESPAALSNAEQQAMRQSCARQNFCLFHIATPLSDPETQLDAMGRQIGLDARDHNLCAEDSGVTAITVKETATDHNYIPYTDRPLGWHTDGYYNPPTQQVSAMLLYCANPAAQGGANAFLDHQIAYIRMRDENPDWIRAMMAPDALTIPANHESGRKTRPDSVGPVFRVRPDGELHMRYSARQRFVHWKDDRLTRDAAAFLLALFEAGDEHMVRYRLRAGEGVLNNNILHRRDGFRDDPGTTGRRLYFRARYYQRLGST